MSDKLKDYIKEHAAEFDVLEAPDLWPAISAGLTAGSGLIKSSKLINMIKYGFGASVVVVTTSIIYLLNAENRQSIRSDIPRAVQEALLTLPDSSYKESEPVKIPAVKKSSGKVERTSQDFLPPADFASENVVAPAEAVNPPEDTTKKVAALLGIDTLFKNVSRMEVEVSYCNVRLNGHSAEGLRMNAKLNESGDMIVLGKKAYLRSKYLLRYKQEKEVLKVWMEKIKLEEKEKVEICDHEKSLIDFEIPDGMELVIRNHSGNISLLGSTLKIAELKSDFGNILVNDVEGELQLKANSGNVKVAAVKGNISSSTNFGNEHFEQVRGNIMSHSSSGQVVISRLTGNADVSTSFGNQKFSDVTGDIKASASSGGIRVQNLKGNLNCKTAFGTQKFHDVEGNIKAEASSGSIGIEKSRGELVLSTSFGNIKGSDVTVVSSSNLQAHSGNISIDFANELRDFRFDLKAGSGTVSVGDGPKQSTSNKTLQLGEGSILISGNTTFGNQVYR